MTHTALPKGPRSALPQLLHMRDPFPLMVALAWDYEDPMTLPILGAGKAIVMWKPDGVKAFFTADPDTFVPGANEALALILGRGSIFLMSGPEHRRARKLLMPPFHGDRMRAYGEVMRAAALRWMREWRPGERFTVLRTTQGITLDVIIEALFGVQEPERIRQFHHDILSVVDSFNPLIAVFKFLQRSFGGYGPWAKFQRNTAALNASLRELVADKRASPGDDILSLLLAVRDEDGDTLSEQEILEQLLSFIVAGHETTATSLAWAMYLLHRNPPVLARLREALGALGEAASPDAVARLPLLDAVCQETLRLYPPVPMVTRKLTRDFDLAGYTIPAGMTVGAAAYMAHVRPETFPDPFELRPDRFLERTYSPFEYMPFGGGARRCLGAAFAMYEMKIVLAAMLSAGPLQLDEPKPVRNVFRIGTYGPETGVRMTLQG